MLNNESTYHFIATPGHCDAVPRALLHGIFSCNHSRFIHFERWRCKLLRAGYQIGSPLHLRIYQFAVCYFCCSIANAVHLSHPLHRIGCFQLFGHALTLCHLLYQSLEQFFCLPIYVGEVAVQLAAGQQVGIAYTMMFLEIPKMPLTPYPDMYLFFLR